MTVQTGHAVDAHADLNAKPASPVHAVALTRIAQAGPDGLDGKPVAGTLRALFLRRGWITATTREGHPAQPRDWTARLHLTAVGEIQLAAAMSRPVDLTDAQALALARIERAGPEGYLGYWPGDGADLAVCELFELVTARTATQGTQKWFALTDTGRAALQRWQATPRKPVKPTPAQAALLGELIDGHTARRDYNYASGTYQACEAQRWISRGELDERGCQPLFITATGREAHKRYTATPPPVKTRPTRVSVGRLEKGQTVRLANRAGYRTVGPQWVKVDHLEHVRPIGGQPGGYIVWITDGATVRRYAEGTCFHPVNRFEIKP